MSRRGELDFLKWAVELAGVDTLGCASINKRANGCELSCDHELTAQFMLLERYELGHRYKWIPNCKTDRVTPVLDSL